MVFFQVFGYMLKNFKTFINMDENYENLVKIFQLFDNPSLEKWRENIKNNFYRINC